MKNKSIELSIDRCYSYLDRIAKSVENYSDNHSLYEEVSQVEFLLLDIADMVEGHSSIDIEQEYSDIIEEFGIKEIYDEDNPYY